MESKTVLITPEIAEDLLTNNSINRPFNKANLVYLKSQLLSGHWLLTHQGIAISNNGVVLDGQHRLRAVLETGISVEMLVTSNVEESVFSVLDTGKRRDGSDVLSVNGASNTHTTSSAIKNYIHYKTMPELVWGNRVICNKQVLEQYESDIEGWQWASTTAQKAVLRGIVVPGPLSCFNYLARQKGHELSALEEFCNSIKEGAGLKKGNPIHAFRNKCILSTVKRQHSQLWLANYIKLYNLCFKGDELLVFKQQAYLPMPSIVKAN
jgi:hypothetical protein